MKAVSFAAAGANAKPGTMMVLLLCVGSTCGCMTTRQAVTESPVVFQAPPDAQQIVQAVNDNAARVKQLHAENVRLSVPGEFGSVKAKLDFDRPSRFRLSGESLRGRELDLGANETQYWIWIKQKQPPTVFFGNQEQFHQGLAHKFMPLPPNQIFADALGLLYLDPSTPYQVFSSAPGLLQVRAPITTAQGDLLRIIEVDQRRALVVKQLIYGPNNELLASVDASDFTYKQLENVSLPRTLKVNLPPAGLAFQLDVDDYTVNTSSPPSTFEMPKIPQHRYLDLANPADMQGIHLIGSGVSVPDLYDSQSAENRPVSSPRTAWQRIMPFNVFRR